MRITGAPRLSVSQTALQNGPTGLAAAVLDRVLHIGTGLAGEIELIETGLGWQTSEPRSRDTNRRAWVVSTSTASSRFEVCPRHGTPYDRRGRCGSPHCRKCEAEASVRYRRSHPGYQRPPLTEESGDYAATSGYG
jgi:hypothetical protein